MAINSKQKGKVGELEVANILKKRGYKARRGQQYCGANGDPDVIGLDGFHIEVKRIESGHGKAYEWYEQAVNDSREGETPIVVHRKNRAPWLVSISFDDFLDLISK